MTIFRYCQQKAFNDINYLNQSIIEKRGLTNIKKSHETALK